MGEYEPRDSRIVTKNPGTTPIEPERTGPREESTRRTPQDRTRSEEEDDESDERKRWQVEERGRSKV